MDSSPWKQVERYGPEDDDSQGYGPPSTMSVRIHTDLPVEPSSVRDDPPPSRTTAAATTQGEQTKGAGSTPTTAGTEKDASTYTSPLRIQDTTVELSSTTHTAAFSTPQRASIESAATATGSPSTELSSPAHSTLLTATSSGIAGSVAAGAESSGGGSTALPDVSATSRHGMSHGEVAAAVIMPILAALAIFAALFLCRRRRKRRDSASAPLFPAMMEKMNHFRPRASSPSTITPPATPAPILTNASNNAYYTGLDTSSHGSRHSSSQEYYAPRQSDGDPPPPYNYETKPPQLPAVDAVGGAFAVPQLREPEPAVRTRSPFEDPVSPLDQHEQAAMTAGGILLSPIDPPETASRSNTISRAPSFSSTQYSDTASVHSARAARMSVGGTQMIMSSSPTNQRSPLTTTRRSDDDEDEIVTPTADRHRSIFDDPASPISSIASTEFHTLPGSRRGSVVSDVGAR